MILQEPISSIIIGKMQFLSFHVFRFFDDYTMAKFSQIRKTLYFFCYLNYLVWKGIDVTQHIVFD